MYLLSIFTFIFAIQWLIQLKSCFLCLFIAANDTRVHHVLVCVLYKFIFLGIFSLFKWLLKVFFSPSSYIKVPFEEVIYYIWQNISWLSFFFMNNMLRIFRRLSNTLPWDVQLLISDVSSQHAPLCFSQLCE